VTSTIAFEGAGAVVEYVGGYVDWLRQRRTAIGDEARSAEAERRASAGAAAAAAPNPAGARRKLSYNEQRELEALPPRIAAFEAEHAQLEGAVASQEFYKQGAEAIAQTLERIRDLEHELLIAYTRLDELKERT
jgi:ATP-binding cassette subfamily F protein uup